MRYQALATDYDGTLAHDGHVSKATVAALQRLRMTGRRVLLVTGREMPELAKTCPHLDLFDLIVAENGALLYWPADGREEVLGEAPSDEFILEMNHQDVKPYSVGRVIFATWRPHEVAVLEAIQRLGMGHQIIFNKDAVMVLPSNINKATGLVEGLRRMELSPQNVVGIGDAENDHAFLEICNVAVAVDNALPSLKARCDLVTAGHHGHGVVELIDRIISDDLESLGPRRPRQQVVLPGPTH